MDYLIWLTAALILWSKYLDCRTTARFIRHISDEQNPLARNLMRHFGIRTVIWGVFGLSAVIVGVSLAIVYVVRSPLYNWLFIGFGLCIALAQFAVAHTNRTGRLNHFTKVLQRMYG